MKIFKDDRHSIILCGAALIICMLIGHLIPHGTVQQQNERGDITVPQLTLIDEQGNPLVILDADKPGGFVHINNNEREKTAEITTDENGEGLIVTLGKDIQWTITYLNHTEHSTVRARK